MIIVVQPGLTIEVLARQYYDPFSMPFPAIYIKLQNKSPIFQRAYAYRNVLLVRFQGIMLNGRQLEESLIKRVERISHFSFLLRTILFR